MCRCLNDGALVFCFVSFWGIASNGGRGGAVKGSQWDRKEKEYAQGGKPQKET